MSFIGTSLLDLKKPDELIRQVFAINQFWDCKLMTMKSISNFMNSWF